MLKDERDDGLVLLETFSNKSEGGGVGEAYIRTTDLLSKATVCFNDLDVLLLVCQTLCSSQVWVCVCVSACMSVSSDCLE